MNNPYISVIIPVYNCGSCLIALYSRLKGSLEKVSSDFEIILINDASPDDAWEIITDLADQDNRIKGINLSRNFGQHSAITAGMDYCQGNWVVVMDCDLQEQPEDIIKLHNKAMEGFDIVLGKRTNRYDPFLNKVLSSIFYKLLSFLTDIKLDPDVGTFRIMTTKVVKNYRLLNERLLFFNAMITWLGFKVAYVDVNHNVRQTGKTSYNLRKRIRLAINGIISFSDKPLKIIICTGVIISLFALIFIVIMVVDNIINGTEMLGWSLLIAAIGLSTGLLIIVIGIVGLYVGSILKEVKQRPRYIYRDLINIE